MDWNALITPLVAAAIIAGFGAITAMLLAAQTWFQEWIREKAAKRKQEEQETKEKQKEEAVQVVARKVDSTAVAAARAAEQAKKAVEAATTASSDISSKLNDLKDSINGEGILGELKKLGKMFEEHQTMDDEQFAKLHEVIEGKKKSKDTDSCLPIIKPIKPKD